MRFFFFFCEGRFHFSEYVRMRNVSDCHYWFDCLVGSIGEGLYFLVFWGMRGWESFLRFDHKTCCWEQACSFISELSSVRVGTLRHRAYHLTIPKNRSTTWYFWTSEAMQCQAMAWNVLCACIGSHYSLIEFWLPQCDKCVHWVQILPKCTPLQTCAFWQGPLKTTTHGGGRIKTYSSDHVECHLKDNATFSRAYRVPWPL